MGQEKALKRFRGHTKDHSQKEEWSIINGTIFHAQLTGLLVRGLNIISVANKSADSIVHTVTVGFLGSLVQQVVRHQTRVSLIQYILQTNQLVTYLTGLTVIHCPLSKHEEKP